MEHGGYRRSCIARLIGSNESRQKFFACPQKSNIPALGSGESAVSRDCTSLSARARACMLQVGSKFVRSCTLLPPSLFSLRSCSSSLLSFLFFFFFFSFEIVVIVAVFVGFAVTQGQNPREKNTIGNRVDVVTERKVERKREREREKGRKEYRNPNGGYSRSTRKVLITSLHGPLEDASWKVESQPGPGSFDLPRNCAHYLSNLISRSACYSFNEFLIRSRH